MIRQHPDGPVEVDIWTHPRSLKLHIRSDCRAMRSMAFATPSQIFSFDTIDEAQHWFDGMRSPLAHACRWCFPMIDNDDDDDHQEQATGEADDA